MELRFPRKMSVRLQREQMDPNWKVEDELIYFTVERGK